MSYYRICPICGAALDPCEQCDCQNKERPFQCANTERAKAETGLPNHVSVPHFTKYLEGNQPC